MNNISNTNLVSLLSLLWWWHIDVLIISMTHLHWIPEPIKWWPRKKHFTDDILVTVEALFFLITLWWWPVHTLLVSAKAGLKAVPHLQFLLFRFGQLFYLLHSGNESTAANNTLLPSPLASLAYLMHHFRCGCFLSPNPKIRRGCITRTASQAPSRLKITARHGIALQSTRYFSIAIR